MTKSELTLRAGIHDVNLGLAVSQLSQSIIEIGKELAVMRDEELWRYIHDPETDGGNRGCFTSWRDYARYRLGSMSTSKMYDYLSAVSLTYGEKPISAATVEQLGVKKAAQIARLPEKHRTKKLLKEIESASVAVTKELVDARLEEPGVQKKTQLIPLTIALPQETIDLINEVERDGVFMEDIRDGDRSWTLRAKLWHAVWVSFRTEYQEDLKAAAFYREYQKTHANENQKEVAVQ